MPTWLCVAHEKEIHNLKKFTRVGFTPYALGVGQFFALAEFSRLVTLEKPKQVVLVGTCGSLYKADIFQLYHATQFAFPSIEGEELPEFLPHTVETTPAWRKQQLPTATVLQNAGISLDAQKFIKNTGYIPPHFAKPILENMEAASLALYCSKSGIAFSALLCVTNTIGKEGRVEWLQNYRKAGEILTRLLLS